MKKDELDILAESPAVELKFIHSSGPGGQNVNKVATAAQLRYDLSLAPLTAPQLARLRDLARVTSGNEVVITARNHRSQLKNRQEALARLRALIQKAQAPPPRPRRATRPTKRAVEKRLETKRLTARRKAARARYRSGEGD